MHRCQIHKRRNILGHLPDHRHARVQAVLTEAWSLGDAQAAQRHLLRLAASLDTDHPGAAASVREGLAETLTLQTLGIGGALYRKLRSTNAIENLNSRVVAYARHVKRWQSPARAGTGGADGGVVPRRLAAPGRLADTADRWSYAG